MPIPGPQDYGDVEPTPRSQAWSAQPEPDTDRFSARQPPGVYVPPPPVHPAQTQYISRSDLRRRAQPAPPRPGPPVEKKSHWGWAVFALLVLVGLAAVSVWAWRSDSGADDAAVIQRSADVQVGECVRVEGAADAAQLRKTDCDFGNVLSYYVAAKVDGACTDQQYASFRLPEGSPAVVCMVPNLVQGRCYEMAPPGRAGLKIRTKDLACGTAPTQSGAVAAEVVLRRDGSRVDCPTGTTSEVVVTSPRPLQYCLRDVS